MPNIESVNLVISEDPRNKRILNTVCTVKVSMTTMERCVDRQCSGAVNKEFVVNASVYAEDLGTLNYSPLDILGSQNLEWPEGQSTVDVIFRKSFVLGEELNEDYFFGFNLEDEIVPSAEIRTRNQGVFVTKRNGPVVTGFF